jgi:hypothetical protein
MMEKSVANRENCRKAHRFSPKKNVMIHLVDCAKANQEFPVGASENLPLHI